MDGHQDPRMMVSEVVILVDGLRGPSKGKKRIPKRMDGGWSFVDGCNKIESTKRCCFPTQNAWPRAPPPKPGPCA